MTINQTNNNEKTRPLTSETPEDRSQSTVVPAIPDSKGKATSSPWIEKYEMGSGKNKINVRIFKEPQVEPVILEAQGGA